jgi:hypothetical protein
MRAKKASKKPTRRAVKRGSAAATGKSGAKAKTAGRKSPKKDDQAPGQSARGTPPVLRPLPVYEFASGGLMGYVRLADPDRGFEFCRSLTGRALPATCREVLSLRHYLSRGAGGLLAPREMSKCDGRLDKDSITFRYGKADKWPVEVTARYDLLDNGGLDATFAFRFSKDLKGFEAGVETIVPRACSGIHVHAGGRWTSASPGPKAKRFYPRNVGAAEFIADGRWNGLRMAGTGLSVESRGYDYPMLVVWEPGDEWALAYMGLTEECSSVWVNGAEPALGMALVGANVRARSAVTCRLRALLCQIDQLDDVLPYYRDFVQEARTSRKH